MNLQKLGNILREKREALGIPLAVLARKASVGRSTLWALERGENPKTGKPSRPARDILQRLGTALRLEPADLGEVLALAGYEESQSLSQNAGQATKISQTRLLGSSLPPMSNIGKNGERERIQENEPPTAQERQKVVKPQRGIAVSHSFIASASPSETSEVATPQVLYDLQSFVTAINALHEHLDSMNQKLEGMEQLLKQVAYSKNPDAEQKMGQLTHVYQDESKEDKTPHHTRHIGSPERASKKDGNGYHTAEVTEQEQGQQSSKKKQGLLFVLSGIGGSENTDIINGLKKRGIDIFVSLIHTTRRRHLTESQGNPHIFISDKLFQSLRDEGALLTYLYNDMRPEKRPAWYGHELEPIMQSLDMGQDVIMDAGPEEASQVRKIKPDSILIHLKLQRDARPEEENKLWEERLQRIKDDYQIEYNYTVYFTYGHLHEAVDDLSSIIWDEREKTWEDRTASEQSESQMSNEDAD